MTPYEQNCRKIAEEMQITGTLVANSHNFEHVYIPAARIALKHMADEVETALQEHGMGGDSDKQVIKKYLQSNGLIPSPENKEQ